MYLMSSAIWLFTLNDCTFQIGEKPPATLNVTTTALIKAPNPKKMLENNFALGDLPLKIPHDNNNLDEYLSKYQRLRNVRDINRDVKGVFQLLINHKILKFLTTYSTRSVLKLMVGCKSTMILTNIMGPKDANVVDNQIDRLMFWSPHMYVSAQNDISKVHCFFKHRICDSNIMQKASPLIGPLTLSSNLVFPELTQDLTARY